MPRTELAELMQMSDNRANMSGAEIKAFHDRVETLLKELISDERAEPLRGVENSLPGFVAGHQLVAFHRGDDEATRMVAHLALTDEEHVLQERLDEMNASGGEYVTDDVVVVGDLSRADGVTSWDVSAEPLQHTDGFDERVIELEWMHRPVLDIDFPAALVPSTTPGHFHLYLDRLMSWRMYEQLLEALADAGIIERGYATASTERGYSSVRLPWVSKESGAVADEDRTLHRKPPEPPVIDPAETDPF